MVRLALLSALSDRADIGRIAVIDDWGIEEPDTHEAAIILRRLRLKGSVLVVLANDEVSIALSLRNLPEASITTHAELSAHDVIKADWLLFSDRTLPTSPSDFSGTHEVEPAEAAPAKAETEAETSEAEAETATEAKPAKKPRATRKTKAPEAEAAPTDEATDADTEAEAAPRDESTDADTEAPSEEGDADA
jgi:hypothetical protein